MGPASAAVAPRLSDIDSKLFGGVFAVPLSLGPWQLRSVAVLPATANVEVEASAESGLDFGNGLIKFDVPVIKVSAVGMLGPTPRFAAGVESQMDLAGARLVAEASFDWNDVESEPFEIRPLAGDFPSLGDLLQEVLPAVPALPDLGIRGLELRGVLSQEPLRLSAALGKAWKVPLGVTELILRDLNVEIESAADGVTTQLNGKLSLLGSELAISSDLAESKLALSSDLPSVDLSELLSKVAGNALALPDWVPPLALGKSRFRVGDPSSQPELRLESRIDGFGTVVGAVSQIAGDWEYFVGMRIPGERDR